MLGKLIKHELRATAHTMLPVLGIMLLVSALANLGARLMNGREVPAVVTVLFTLVVILFVTGLFAIGLVTVLLMVQRFRGNLLRDEGYIMHTLPVSVHAHIWSKVIVSTLWYALTGVTVVLSVMLAAMDIDFIRSLGQMLGEFAKLMSEDIKNVEILTELLALLVLGGLTASLSFDAALSIGHSFANRKMLLSVCVFVGMIILSQLTTVGLFNLFDWIGVNVELDAYNITGFMGTWRFACGVTALLMTFYGAICYGVTAFFMKRRLNLE